MKAYLCMITKIKGGINFLIYAPFFNQSALRYMECFLSHFRKQL